MFECCLCKKWYHQDCVGIKTEIQNGHINVEYKDEDDENTGTGTEGSRSQKEGAVEATGEDVSDVNETCTDIDGTVPQKLRMISCTGSVFLALPCLNRLLS